MPRVVALFRKSSYSPAQHRTNDTAILDDTLAHLTAEGWDVVRAGEAELDRVADVTPGRWGEAALYLSMCQGPATARLLPLEAADRAGGAPVVNRPASVLACHRHRLVPALAAAGLPSPVTDLVDLAALGAVERMDEGAVARAAAADGGLLWMKRGDVHAERADDVVQVRVGDVREAAAAFRARGIGRVALQAHVAGPVLKFYGISGGGVAGGAGGRGAFFRWYDAANGPTGARPAVDEARLRAVAFGAARALGLEVFGGDVALPAPDAPVLIDVNDWPSFAPYRAEAAAAIASYALDRVARASAPMSSARATAPVGVGGHEGRLSSDFA